MLCGLAAALGKASRPMEAAQVAANDYMTGNYYWEWEFDVYEAALGCFGVTVLYWVGHSLAENLV